MSVEDEQLKDLIVLTVNDVAGGVVESNITLIWNMYADKGKIANAPRLQYYYALKHAIQVMMGSVRAKVNIVVGQQKAEYSSQFTNLKSMLDDTVREIAKIEKEARVVRSPAIAALTNVNPITPNSDPRTINLPDPNDRQLRGDPLLPTDRRGQI
ncbi:MAG: hypothetical protein HXX08_11380 [Chloroflexi bacterium]|uniref:Uncharacterized protein n=1 Tax=Candidatus Chlorohelix allophototropha TaxID=3003348 RepID=A0A8T7M2T6_9CHLR|nr:hypothetical protein [Chloroflexota bacterium]WJW65839.1 hypothetical protein OZ401_001618 [Chloroflexota bacterium L227-S17]